MKLSVIIPCFNAADTIAEQLEALACQEWSEPWEIIIAENGSIDRTKEILQKYQQTLPNLRIVDASKKKGAAHARNVGANAAQSEKLAFCDADDVVNPGWVAAMGEALSQNDFVGGVSKHSQLNEPDLLKIHGCEEDAGVAFDHPYLPCQASANLAVKRSVHQAVGGFDENLKIIEDIDYCWRIQRTGVEMKEASNAIIQYRLRQNIKEICRREMSLGFNEPSLYKKHRPYGLPQMIYWTTWIKTPIKFCLHLLSFKIRDKATLNEWFKNLAYQKGQIQGCIHFRYLPGIFHPGKFN